MNTVQTFDDGDGSVNNGVSANDSIFDNKLHTVSGKNFD